jgi:hypothetical protein
MLSTGVSVDASRARPGAPSQAQVAAMLRGLGVEAEDLPGFLAVFILMLALVDATVISGLLPLRLQLLPGLGLLTEVVVSYILAFVLYRLGELWDAALEARNWRWVRVLPHGRDLDQQRTQAQERLGERTVVYDAAVRAIRASNRSDLVTLIEASRARARLCRTLILPVALLGLVCLVAPDWNLNLAGLASVPLVVGLLVAYANERVLHVRQLYAAVGEI